MIENFYRGFAAIGLHHPKTAHNVGSVLRAAGCYGASLVCLAGRRFEKASTDTQKQHRHTPLIRCADLKDVIPHGAVPIAVELPDGLDPFGEATSLPEYQHPERAFYIFGPEDGTLGMAVTSWCKDTIYIPTRHCMNLAATVNVVLYDRMVKRGEGAARFSGSGFDSFAIQQP
jgi:tRNA(Leu) C34 or U34 (ribose-2'-O)-methylase TrmL